jgi:hypothetical protein
MANHVTTEWEDIQVKMGNYVPTEKQTESNDKIQQIAIEEMQKYDPLANKTVEQLDELEDEEDDEVLKRYKEKRLKEMKELASRPHFGKLLELKKQDYIQEVTNAPKGVYVVLHLYQDYLMDCKILDKIFDSLAHRFVLVKFMRIRANECVEGLKDKDVPAVIIYHDGQLLKQLIPASYYFGGAGKLSPEKVEWILGSLKVIKTELENDPFDEDDDSGFKVTKAHKQKKEDYDSDSEDDGRKKDREYGWNFIRK